MQEILDFLAANQNILGFLCLMVASFIEYVFPPFPGDTVLLLGGVLVAASGWSPVFVISAATFGAVLGSWIDFELGRWIRRRPSTTFARFLRRRGLDRAVRKVVSRFERHGSVYIAINRFLPGIRGFFFVAAGMANLPLRSVLLWGTLSALAWNAFVLTMGFVLGGNLDAVQTFFERYTLVAWGLIAAIVLFFLGRAWLESRRAPSTNDHEENE